MFRSFKKWEGYNVKLKISFLLIHHMQFGETTCEVFPREVTFLLSFNFISVIFTGKDFAHNFNE